MTVIQSTRVRPGTLIIPHPVMLLSADSQRANGPSSKWCATGNAAAAATAVSRRPIPMRRRGDRYTEEEEALLQLDGARHGASYLSIGMEWYMLEP